MKDKLNDVLTDAADPLNVYRNLAEVVIAGVDACFAIVFADNNAKLAAVVHPALKLDWLDNKDQKQLC